MSDDVNIFESLFSKAINSSLFIVGLIVNFRIFAPAISYRMQMSVMIMILLSFLWKISASLYDSLITVTACVL